MRTVDSGLGFEPFEEPPLELTAPPSFRADFEARFGNVARYEEVMTALEWALARSGDRALLVGDSYDRWVIMFDVGNTSWILEYEVDDVRLGWARPIRIQQLP